MYKQQLSEDKHQYSAAYDIDPQAEWQEKFGKVSVDGQPENPDLVMSSSQIEESLLGDLDTLHNFSIGSDSDSFEVNSLHSYKAPSTPISSREDKDTRGRTPPGYTSEQHTSSSRESGIVTANISAFEKTAAAANKDASKDRHQKKTPITSPNPTKSRDKNVDEDEAKGSPKGTIDTQEGVSVEKKQTNTFRVMYLDQDFILRPVENEKQLAEVVKSGFVAPQSRNMNDILMQFTTSPIDIIHHFSFLGQHINTLHQNDLFLDVIIYLGNQIFKAHRVVLSCYSKYFRDSFITSSGKTKIPLEVKLNGISPDAFRLFLQFIYSGVIEIMAENIGEIAIAAELLDISILKEMTSEYMKEINVSQALIVIETGNIPQSSEIHKLSYASVMEHFSKCYDTNPFNMLSLDNLCMVLADDHLLVSTEMDVFWAGLKWIAFQMNERQQHLNRVMECVRFPYLSQTDIFKCLETTDLLRTSERCKQLLIAANWIVSSEARKQTDLLKLPKPLPRLCLRPATIAESNDTFLSIPDDFTISLPELRETFSCEVMLAEEPYTVDWEKSCVDAIKEEQSSKRIVPLPAARSISPTFLTGDILVIGGFQMDEHKDTHTEKRIERYCSHDNQWKYYAELPEPRHHHAATLLGGKLYLTGGINPKRTITKRSISATNNVFQFDPENKCWRPCTSMNTPRMYHRLCALYGMLYAIGGMNDKSQVVSSVECYNPKTNGWVFVRPMNDARMGSGATVSDGKLYVAGGHGGQLIKKTNMPILQTMEVFDPRNNLWTLLTDLRIPRCFPTLVSISSKLYLCGGATRSMPIARDGNLSSVGMVEVFDPQLNAWEYKTEMIIPRHHHGVAVIGSTIFLLGGMSTTTNKTLQSVECIDTKTETFDNSFQDLPMPAKWICCVVLPVPK